MTTAKLKKSLPMDRHLPAQHRLQCLTAAQPEISSTEDLKAIASHPVSQWIPDPVTMTAIQDFTTFDPMDDLALGMP